VAGLHDQGVLGAKGDRAGATAISGDRAMKEMRREYDFSRGRRGAVIRPPLGKTRITIRLDNEVLEWFRRQVHAAGGGSYQTMINQVLRDHVRGRAQGMEEALRRVMRQELARARRKP
jgi:uncharacterized protein (DUF4415 family)